jgi:hypothetical protein
MVTGALWAAAHRYGDVADAGADDADAVVAVAQLDAHPLYTGHQETGVNGAVETEVDSQLTVAHGNPKDVSGCGPGDSQDSVLQPRRRAGRGARRGGGRCTEQAGYRGGHGRARGQTHVCVHLLLHICKGGLATGSPGFDPGPPPSSRPAASTCAISAKRQDASRPAECAVLHGR